jgi:hypothetical protein
LENYYSVNTSDPVTRAIDDNVARVFASLQNNPLLDDPSIVKDIKFVSGVDTVINHKQASPVVGFIVVNLNAPAIIYKSNTNNIAPSVHIILKSNLDCIASILFF